jgi:hypothetical protein
VPDRGRDAWHLCRKCILSKQQFRDFAFGAAEPGTHERSAEFELKKAIVELFTYIRRIDEGKILCVEVCRGVPRWVPGLCFAVRLLPV